MDNGALAWAVALGIPLAWDGILVRFGHTSLTCHVRRHPAVAVTGGLLLTAHFLGQPRALRRFDPLAMAARRLAPSAAPSPARR